MTICREIRAKIDIPILMVSARIEDTDKIRGLGLGADDYIIKPFSPAELVARVKSHIARYERLTRQNENPQKPAELDFGWLTINKGTHQVFVNGMEISLANKEYELLCLLAGNAQLVLSKNQIYDRIWGEEKYGDIKTVTVHINRLREKIEYNSAKPEHIQTVYGAGYRFKS
jgi:DNA-binding response OmpR family regulator